MSLFLQILFTLLMLVEVILVLHLLHPLFTLLATTLVYRKSRSGCMKVKDMHPIKDYDFAAIITAHQDVRFIEPFVDSFLKQTYKKFMVYVIADDCDISGLHFEDERIKIIRPETPFHSKVKSIQFGVESFVRKHDAMVIFDSDCLVHPAYFERLNAYFVEGFPVVQTIMLSKNSATVFAKVDSIGWVYNTFMERDSRMAMGLSSTISGNGIAIRTDLYADVMYVDSLGGFDKRLQAHLVKKVDRIAFANDVIVYDEKVNDANAFETQRTRWLYSYFKYLGDAWGILAYGLKRMEFNKFFFGFHALRPPLFLLLGITTILMLLNLLINPWHALVLFGAIISFLISFIVIALTKGYQPGMGKAILHLPHVVWIQIRAFLRMGKAGKSFLKTEHSEVIYIDQLVK